MSTMAGGPEARAVGEEACMRPILAALVLLSLPLSAGAQTGQAYQDKFGDPLLFADVDIPIRDQTGQYLVDPASQRPIFARSCLTVPANETQTDVTKRTSTSDANWLQGIHYMLDLAEGQIIIRHVWVLDTIKTAQSPGYQVVHSPRMVNYDFDDYRAPLLHTRPPDIRDGHPCDWDRIMANLTVTRNEPVQSRGGGGGGQIHLLTKYPNEQWVKCHTTGQVCR